MYENIKNKNVMLLDVQYVKQNKRKNTPDVLYTIYKDLDTGEKKLDISYEPRQDIYFEKPEYRDHSYSKIFAPMNEVYVKHVKHKDIIKAIVEEGGPQYKKAYNQALTSGNYNELEKFHLAPFAFATDFDVRVWHRLKWYQEKNNSLRKVITKGWMDIEVDSIDIKGFANSETCPINAISLIDGNEKVVYLFALVGRQLDEEMVKRIDRGNDNELRSRILKLRDYYEKGLKQQHDAYTNIDDLKKTAHEMFDESYPGFDYRFFFYKDDPHGTKQGKLAGEAKLLVDFFALVNTLKLDFIEIWNMKFDIPYIMDRLRYNGLSPEDVMCHPDFPIKQCYYKSDEYHFSVKNKTDFFYCSSYTLFVDQMIVFAAIRKGGQEYRSYKLNTIGYDLLNDEKLNYSEEGDIKTIAYVNYKKFLMYNIKDTLLQYGIEKRTEDLDNYYILSLDNITPYENVFKQTVFLRNLKYLYFVEKMNLIPGNNVNAILNRGAKDLEQLEEEVEMNEERDDGVWDEKSSDEDAQSITVSFEGALNADPTLNNKNGRKLFGKKTNNIFDLAIDLDAKAFYPNSNRSMNITPNALIFKAYVSSNQFLKGDKSVHGMFKDMYNVPDCDVAKDLFDNFLTHDYLYSCHKWMNLPSVDEMYDIINEKLGE